MNKFNNKKKKGIFSILLPYLVCLGIVLLVVNFFSGSGTKDSKWNQNQLVEKIDATVDELTASPDKEPTIVFKNVTATFPETQSNLYTMVGTYDGSSVKFYLDGTLVTSTATTGNITVPGTPMLLGADPDSNDLSSVSS